MKYFLLQLKRVFKLFPFVAVLIAVFVAVFVAVFSNFAKFMSDEEQSRFKIGVVGETDNNLFSMGISAVKSFDSSRYSIDITELPDEKTAAQKLRSGDIAAYIVAPAGFTNAIEHGRIMPLKYCSTESYVDVGAIFKNEITAVVSTYLKESQRGIFATNDLLHENGYDSIADDKTNELGIRYVDLILDRSKMYKTETTGFSYGLSFTQYIAIGLTVTFICIFIIPFATLFSRKDTALIKTLSAGGISAAAQVAAEFFAMLLAYLSVFVLIVSAAFCFGDKAGIITSSNGVNVNGVLLRIFPVVITVCAFAFLIFEISGNIITAVSGYFFLSFALCYISGCVYPIFALPQSLQKAAEFTPFGVARAYLSAGAVGDSTAFLFLCLMCFAAVFFILAVLVRKRKVIGGEG